MKRSTIESRMGTWGVVLKPNRKTNVFFEQPFHLKMAVLDFNSFVKQEFHFRVMLLDNNDELATPLTVCILSKQSNLQSPLDLQFEPGDDVTLFVKTDPFNMDVNSFSVHLSGISGRLRDTFVEKRRASAILMRNFDGVEKSRSFSTPDECFANNDTPKRKDGFSSLERRQKPQILTSSAPCSPVKKSLVIEDAVEPPKSPRSNAEKPINWSKTSFREKIGKLLSKSESSC